MGLHATPSRTEISINHKQSGKVDHLTVAAVQQVHEHFVGKSPTAISRADRFNFVRPNPESRINVEHERRQQAGGATTSSNDSQRCRYIFNGFTLTQAPVFPNSFPGSQRVGPPREGGPLRRRNHCDSGPEFETGWVVAYPDQHFNLSKLNGGSV